MPRKRMIDPSFWEDPTIGTLSIPARLLFIGMVSHADDYGRLEVEPRYIRRAVFGFDDEVTTGQVGDLLCELQSKCRNIVFYQVDGRALACFTNWKRYQYIQKIQDSRLPEPPVTEQYHTVTVPVTPNRIEENRIEENRSERKPARTRTTSAKSDPDPLLANPAIIAYRDAFKLTPKAELRTMIATQVTDLDRWQVAIDYWRTNNYRPESVGKLIDRYLNGDPFERNGTNGHGPSRNSRGEKTYPASEVPPYTYEEMLVISAENKAKLIAAGEWWGDSD